MKKIDLIQTTILIIAIMLGYQAINMLINWLPTLFFSLSEGNYNFIFTLLLVIVLGICCMLLIKKSRAIAITILKNEPESSQDDFAQLQLDRDHLIFALLIGMGLYYLIWSIPNVALDLFKLYRYKVAPGSFRSALPDSDRIIVELLRITLGAFLVYAAPILTKIISKRAPLIKRENK
jgi:hypothetical protein